jgi:NAD(P)-dependent dehydrogenase (short-subunit alcohol dehydrogenase family)
VPANRPLRDRVALVTGVRRGAGWAIAERLAADGAWVAVSDRRPTPQLNVIAQAVGGFMAVADITDPGQITWTTCRV